jgi:hypothetical protein
LVDSQVFLIEPAAGRSAIGLVALVALMGGLLILFLFFAYSARGTRFEMSDEGLAIRRTMYGRVIPWSVLRLEEARLVDLRTDTTVQPTLRTNGIGMPGYQAGWFRLRQSGRGLLFVTDRSRVIAVPTNDGYTLLVSVQDPSAFLAALVARRGGE